MPGHEWRDAGSLDGAPEWVRIWRCTRCGTEVDSPRDSPPWTEPGQDRLYFVDWTCSAPAQGRVLAECDAEAVRLVMTE